MGQEQSKSTGQEQSAEKQAGELQLAAWTNVSKVKSLLARGANPNHPGYYPLHTACRNGNLEIVKTLVEAGADTKRWDKDGISPVHGAAIFDHKEVLVYLIRDCKCNADARDQNNNTPLHYACYRGHLDVVQYLVEEAHCDINVRDNNNQTVLHRACSPFLYDINYIIMAMTTWWFGEVSNQFAVVKYLVEKANCDINATDDQGRTPLDLAKCEGYKDVVNYLKTRQESSRQPGVESRPAVPLKLLEGAQVTIGHPIVATALGKVTQRGLEDMAGNLRTRLRQSHIGESVVEVTNKSEEFSNFGIKISVPENSLPRGIDTCVLHISFELSTDFEIPANSELVSSIYHVKCEPKVQFKKPLILEIQHCVSLNSGHEQRLVFARATDESKKFEILDGGHFPIGERYGSIQLTRFSWFSTLCEALGFTTERMYSALLFRKNLPHHKIDMKCVVCQNLATHVKVIREELEKDRYTKEMDLDQIQFENAVEMELHSENPELWTVTRVTPTLSRHQIDGYATRVLDSDRRPAVIPAIQYRFNLKENFVSESVNFLLTKTDLDEESHRLTLHIYLPQHPGNRSTETDTQGDEWSLSSEMLQYSADPVQRLGITISSSAGEDNQVRNRRGPNRVTLQKLIRRYNLTDEQLNREIRNFNFSYLAIYFDDVELYSNAMGLASAEQADVNMLYYSKRTQVAMMKCLKIWKQHNASQATYRALLDITLSLGKGETADKICQQLTQHRTLD